jgi:hypothetical protein
LGLTENEAPFFGTLVRKVMRKHDKRLDLDLPNFRRADLLDCFPIGIVFALCQSMSSSLDDTPVYLLLETHKNAMFIRKVEHIVVG